VCACKRSTSPLEIGRDEVAESGSSEMSGSIAELGEPELGALAPGAFERGSCGPATFERGAFEPGAFVEPGGCGELGIFVGLGELGALGDAAFFARRIVSSDSCISLMKLVLRNRRCGTAYRRGSCERTLGSRSHLGASRA
jgi:hypothetical protein